jgi:hypothetical protein
MTMATATVADQKPEASIAAPVIVEKKKGKRKYSNSGTRSFQELEEGLSKSARKVAKAVQDGLDVYLDERKDSATSKKDGAFRDIFRNQSKALRKGLPIAAEAPADLLDAVADMKVVRNILKRR